MLIKIINNLKLKIISMLFLCIAITSSKLYAAPQFSDLTILIPSCDKYSGLWDPFFTLLFKNWPSLQSGGSNQDIPIFFISNKKAFKHPRVQNIQFPNEISWSDNMIMALAKVQTKYVLYLQEDYFLTEKINEKMLYAILQYTKKHNSSYTSLVSMGQSPKFQSIIKESPNLIEIADDSQYRTSLQAAIWEKDTFSWLLKPGESIFAFELDGSKRSEGIKKLFLAHVNNELGTSFDVINYINAVDRGKILISAVNYLHSQGINFEPQKQHLPLQNDNLLTKLKKKIKWKILQLFS